MLTGCLPSITVHGRGHALRHILGYVDYDAPAALLGLAPWSLSWGMLLLEVLQCQLMVLLEERLLEQWLLLAPSIIFLEVAEQRGSQRFHSLLFKIGKYIMRFEELNN